MKEFETYALTRAPSILYKRISNSHLLTPLVRPQQRLFLCLSRGARIVAMQQQDFPELQPKVVLGIAAHADDLDFGVAGTIAKFAAQGAEVHYLIVTDGSKGSSDYDMSTVELAKMRQDEQRNALKALGGKEVHFLGYPDGELEVTMDVKRDIVRVIRSVKPDVVITWDPSVIYSSSRGFVNHPDHRACGQAALDAVYPLARDHMSFPELFAEGYEPHKTKTALLMNFDTANYYVDITDTLEKKFEALKAHASQVPNFAEMRERFTEFAAMSGKEAGFKYAESFVRLDIH